MSSNTSTNEHVRMKPDALIAALSDKIPAAEAYDAERLAEHRSKCVDVGKARRQYLRELVKRPLTELAEASSYDLFNQMPGATSCPTSMVTQFQDAIDTVRLDGRSVFVIKRIRADRFWTLLNWGVEPRSKTVCS